MQKSMRRGRALGRAAHLSLGTFRPPQAAALSVKIGNKAGGTEGREYGGASYPAPLSLAAIVAPTAGRAAEPPVPLSSQHLIPRLTEEPQHRRAGNRGKEGRPRLSGP